MRIAHVVTYISPDGSFGGPARVALAQADALALLGHDVTVYAAAPRDAAGESRRDGYTLKTFPARHLIGGRGFAMMSSPLMARRISKDIRSFDVAHIHLARDLGTIPAALAIRRAKVPYIVQPHGMIDPSSRLLAKPLDIAVTRPLLRNAGSVLVLTDQEQRDIESVEPATTVSRIGNGIRIGTQAAYDGRKKVVLFMARLHERKRPIAFVEMATQLGASFPDVQFIMVGPDEGAAAATLEAIAASPIRDRIKWVGSVSPDETDQWISGALAYVLPSFGEVFPMTILEALRAGTPVVTTDSLGIAEKCISYGAALITNGSSSGLAAAARTVLSDRTVVDSLREGGLRYLRAELDIAMVAKTLEAHYKELGGTHHANK